MYIVYMYKSTSNKVKLPIIHVCFIPHADSGRGASTSNSRPSSQIDHDVIRKSTIATSDEGEGSSSPKQIKGRLWSLSFSPFLSPASLPPSPLCTCTLCIIL